MSYVFIPALVAVLHSHVPCALTLFSKQCVHTCSLQRSPQLVTLPCMWQSWHLACTSQQSQVGVPHLSQLCQLRMSATVSLAILRILLPPLQMVDPRMQILLMLRLSRAQMPRELSMQETHPLRWMGLDTSYFNYFLGTYVKRGRGEWVKLSQRLRGGCVKMGFLGRGE